jgi:hypothetical protein
VLKKLGVLMARDHAIERWLRDQVGPAYDALKADPSRAITAAQVRARLAAGTKSAAKGPNIHRVTCKKIASWYVQPDAAPFFAAVGQMTLIVLLVENQ